MDATIHSNYWIIEVLHEQLAAAYSRWRLAVNAGASKEQCEALRLIHEAITSLVADLIAETEARARGEFQPRQILERKQEHVA